MRDGVDAAGECGWAASSSRHGVDRPLGERACGRSAAISGSCRVRQAVAAISSASGNASPSSGSSTSSPAARAYAAGEPHHLLARARRSTPPPSACAGEARARAPRRPARRPRAHRRTRAQSPRIAVRDPDRDRSAAAIASGTAAAVDGDALGGEELRRSARLGGSVLIRRAAPASCATDPGSATRRAPDRGCAPRILLGLRQFRHDQEFAGARAGDVPEPFALAHQAFAVGLERQRAALAARRRQSPSATCRRRRGARTARANAARWRC